MRSDVNLKRSGWRSRRIPLATPMPSTPPCRPRRQGDRAKMEEDREKMSDGFDSVLDNEANGATVRPAGSRVRGIESFLAGVFSARLGKSAPRIRLAAWVFLGVYGIIAAKLIDFGLRPDPPVSDRRAAADAVAAARPDLLDRNGEL